MAVSLVVYIYMRVSRYSGALHTQEGRSGGAREAETVHQTYTEEKDARQGTREPRKSIDLIYWMDCMMMSRVLIIFETKIYVTFTNQSYICLSIHFTNKSVKDKC